MYRLSLRLLISLWFPAGLAALVGLLRWVRMKSAFLYKQNRLMWLLSFWDLFVVVSIYVMGIAGMLDPQAKPFPQPNTYGLFACNALAVSSLASNILWITLMKGHRLFASCVSAMQLFMLAFASLVAGMSLTGRWI